MSGPGAFLFRSRSQNSLLPRFLACSALLGLGACSGAGELDEPVIGAEAPLIGGDGSPAEFDSVVFVRANHPGGTYNDCSGTLVSSRVVITAKHCVTFVQPGSFVCSGAGTLIDDGTGAGTFGGTIEPANIEVYTGASPVGTASALGARVFSTDSMDACHDDVAAIVLDRPIPGLRKLPLRASRQTVAGERVRLLGYGLGGRLGSPVRTEIANVRVDEVGRDTSVAGASPTTPPRTFVVPGGTACFGDSGGPALSMETDALVGVYSRITGDCFAEESRNTFMLASSFGNLFDRAFTEAEEEPLPEAEPSGSAGSAGASSGTPSPSASRHDAFQCAFGPSSGTRAAVGWLVALLGLGVTRRFGRRPSAGG